MQTEGNRTNGVFLDFRDLIAIIRMNFMLIAGVVAVGTAIGLTYLLLAPQKYSARSEILFETRLQNVSGIEAVLPGLSADRAAIESAIELLSSRQIFDRAVASILKEERDAKRTPAKPDPENYTARLLATSHSAADRQSLMGALKIKRRGISYVVDIEFTDKSPHLAARMANAIANAYVNAQRDEKLRATEWASNQLESRVRKVGQEVQTAFAKLQQYRTDNNLFKIGPDELSERQLANQVQSLTDAKNRAIKAESTVRQTKHLKGNRGRLTTLDKVLASEVILEFRKQYAEVERRLGEAVNRFGQKHVTVANARAELENLTRLIHQEVDRLVSNSRNELEMANIEVVLLTKGLNKLKLEYADQNQARIVLAELERQATASQQLYISLLNRLRETKAQVGLQTDDARVTFNATPPERPSWPKRKLTLALVIFGSSAIGFALALVREMFNQSLRTSRDVSRLTGLSTVASFPKMQTSEPEADYNDAQSDVIDETLIHAGRYPESPYTRSVFRLCYWIEHECREKTTPVVMVASAQESAGTTTLASNLAHFVARSGKRVLLIDCDLRNAALTRHLCRESSGSIRDILQDGTKPNQIIQQMAQPGLSLCPASLDDTSYVSTEVLASDQMSNLFAEVASEYDMVILDTPALMQSTDACALLKSADCAIFVARAGITRHQDVVNSLGQTMQYATLPIGVVLNMTTFTGRRPFWQKTTQIRQLVATKLGLF